MSISSHRQNCHQLLDFVSSLLGGRDGWLMDCLIRAISSANSAGSASDGSEGIASEGNNTSFRNTVSVKLTFSQKIVLEKITLPLNFTFEKFAFLQNLISSKWASPSN
jgi:hypothetical protein